MVVERKLTKVQAKNRESLQRKFSVGTEVELLGNVKTWSYTGEGTVEVKQGTRGKVAYHAFGILKVDFGNGIPVNVGSLILRVVK